MNRLISNGMDKAAPSLLKRIGDWFNGALPEDELYYQQFIDETEPGAKELDRQRRRVFADMPKISVICPLCNPKKKNITEIVASLQAQTYSNWELLFPDASRAREREYNKYLLEDYDKVRHIPQRSHFGYARSAHEAVKAASGEYLLFMEQEGLLAAFALYSLVEALHEYHADFVYGDEDMLVGGERRDPLFKPDWSPDTLNSLPYTGRPTLMSLALYQRSGGLMESAEGAHEYDLALRASRLARNVAHVPKVLYHNREESGALLNEALRSAAVQADPGLFPGSRRARYPIKGRPLVSVILRYKGDAAALERCVNAFIERTTYNNREILLYTGEIKPEEEAYFARFEREGVGLHVFNAPFNASGAANACAKAAAGEYLLFMDSDVEAVAPDWIEAMLEHAQREEIGAVGAKLVAPGGSLRHCGIVIGLGDKDGSLCEGLLDTSDCPLLQNLYSNAVRNVSAVSGACLMVKRSVFMEAGMFDESFIKIGSDVEFCLRLLRKGLWNVYTPFAKLRRHDVAIIEAPRGDMVRSYDAYRHILKSGDPFYNINLDYASAWPRVAGSRSAPPEMHTIMSKA